MDATNMGAAALKWGGLVLGFIGTVSGITGMVLGWRAERRAGKEHAWKEEDAKRKDLEWKRQEAHRSEEENVMAWCRDIAKQLEAQSPSAGGFLHVPLDKVEWARRGEAAGIFNVNTQMPGEAIVTRRR